jgi:hypothetical protein
MIVLKKHYNSLLEECSRLENELHSVRLQREAETRLNKRLRDDLDGMYDQAKVSAAEMSRLHERVQSLEEELKERPSTLLSYDRFETYLNPEPEDQELRNYYVAQISGYFSGGLGDYIKYTISRMKDELTRFPITERESDFFRAGINICELLLEWGQRMQREHMSNAYEDQDTEDLFTTSDAVENIKKAVKKK